MSTVDRPPGIYGQHLMLRLRGVERVALLDDAAGVADLLASLVRAVRMPILAGPCVGTERGDAGHHVHSAVVILDGSHAAVHAYPGRAEVFLDLFSCRAFGLGQILEHCVRHLGAFTVSECTLLDRGHHWTSPTPVLLTGWMASR